MQAHCDSDLQVLVIEGIATDEQLLEAWNEIVFDYSSRVKTDESTRVYDLALQIGLLQFHIGYVDNAVAYLRYTHKAELVEELIRLGYRHLKFEGFGENWERQLNRCVSLCKTRVHDYEQLVDEYERIDKTVTGKRQSYDAFNRNVLMLSKYQGSYINKDTMMMDDYIAIFNNYLEESRSTKNQTGN
jgi:hypothetical protein